MIYKKKLLIFFIPFSLFLVFALLFGIRGFFPEKHHFTKKTSFKEVSSYKIFYGAPNEKILEEMKNYKMVIVEPYEFSKEQVDKIKKNGTIVMGYISVMELDTWKKNLVSKAEPTDYIIRNGSRVHFSKWDSYLMDISSLHYKNLLLNEIKNQVAGKNFDGVFLDTVGDIDDQYSNDPVMLEKQRDALVAFLKEIKHQYPNFLLIQNWGFNTLQKSTVPYVNGVMWENFHYDELSKDPWTWDSINNLKKLQQQYGISVFTVSFKSERENHQFAQSNGFIPFYTNKGFNVW
ncbi:endo alpha-1,4 polygalactosaminidase [Ectobacillus panaciterrae]|uniref:endo alpha-1,4 polygalactosaminidase n=1 Tax=Ectobacillus panaciterrae TaxID=363872 RepID=UPI000408A1D1|nr:endo alpha-1,4 polygalactosaminidase [Ectobacillus panaciterrae]